MINTIVFGIFNLVLWGGVIYLFVLVVKALKKYINAKNTPKDEERDRVNSRLQNTLAEG